ncbi:MAG: transposase zinc-binding domain-containing protein, partial [Archangium sp.]|nr:transposase zinc-binding domain-containing protein [Archangium sp.]
MEGEAWGGGVLREAFRRGWPEVQPLVPKRVREEVERYLRCGDVRYGFVEVACSRCQVPRLVALRCRGRGWCPSCTTRRALETGLQLEDELPRVAHRQWTLSLPMEVRFQVVKQPALLKRLEVRLVQAVWRHQRATAKRLGAGGPLRGGGVC